MLTGVSIVADSVRHDIHILVDFSSLPLGLSIHLHISLHSPLLQSSSFANPQNSPPSHLHWRPGFSAFAYLPIRPPPEQSKRETCRPGLYRNISRLLLAWPRVQSLERI